MTEGAGSSLKGEVAVITGGGRGIGAAIAQKLASLGAVAVLCGRGRALLDSTAAAITAAGGHAETAECDVTDPESVEALAAHISRKFGKIDLLVNNAGIGGFGGPLHQMPLETFIAETMKELAGDADEIAIGGAKNLLAASSPENVKKIFSGMNH